MTLTVRVKANFHFDAYRECFFPKYPIGSGLKLKVLFAGTYYSHFLLSNQTKNDFKIKYSNNRWKSTGSEFIAMKRSTLYITNTVNI